MDVAHVEKRVALMLRGYFQNAGIRAIDELAHPLSKIVLTRDGGVGISFLDEAPNWMAYVHSAFIPSFERLRLLVESAGKGIEDAERRIKCEIQAFQWFSVNVVGDAAKEVCERMLPCNGADMESFEPDQIPSSVMPPDLSPRISQESAKGRAAHKGIFWAASLAFIIASMLPHHDDAVLSVAWIEDVIATAIVISFLPLIVGAFTRFRLPWLLLGLTALMGLCTVAGTPGVWLTPPVATATMPKKAVAPGPNGIVWDDQKGVSSPQPAAGDASRRKDLVDEWNRTALAFESAHPELKFGQNAQIMQANINHLDDGRMSSFDILQKAYMATSEDSRWSSSP